MVIKISAIRGEKLLLACSFLCMSFFVVPLLFAEEGRGTNKNEILVIGTGGIVRGNLALARQRAISQALVKGVESYLLRTLESQDLVNNFQRLNLEVLSGAKEEIENYHILAEYQSVNQYKVLVRLKINENVINEKLREARLILTHGTPLKMLFLVSETREGETSYWWEDPYVHSALSLTELSLHKMFQKRGFRPINRTLGVPESNFSEGQRIADLEDADVLEWGRLFSADVVIHGWTEMISENGLSLRLKAFNVNQGMQICQDMENVEYIEKGLEGHQKMFEAIGRLADRVAERLTPCIIGKAISGRVEIHQLEITLTGLRTYKQFKVFGDFLRRDVTGVISVKQLRVRKNSITIEVEFQGDRNMFLHRVLNHENIPFSLNLDETEEAEIVFKVE